MTATPRPAFVPPTAPAFVQAAVMMVPMDGEDVVVTAASVSQIAALMSHAAALFDAWAAMQPERRKRFAEGAPTAEDLDVLLHLLEDKQGLPAELLATLLGRDVAWVGALLPDRFAYLFACAVGVNADFFSRAGGVFSAAGAVLASAKTAATAAPTAAPKQVA